jgi:hypothetical protein
MIEDDETDPSVPLADGVLANEGVVDHSREERASDVARTGDGAQESLAEQVAELADLDFSKEDGG